MATLTKILSTFKLPTSLCYNNVDSFFQCLLLGRLLAHLSFVYHTISHCFPSKNNILVSERAAF